MCAKEIAGSLHLSLIHIFATLDGDLTEKDNGRKGILEIKTTEIKRQSQWKEWSGTPAIPQHYYVQVLHQLLATGYDFAIVRAQIKHCLLYTSFFCRVAQTLVL